MQGPEFRLVGDDAAALYPQTDRFKRGARTRPFHADPIADPKSGAMRIAQDQLAVARQKSIRLPVQRVAGVGATVDESGNIAVLAHCKELQRPVALTPPELAAAGIGQLVQAAEHDGAGFHTAFRRSSAAFRVMTMARTMAGTPMAEA